MTARADVPPTSPWIRTGGQRSSILVAVEATLACVAVALDLLVPTFVLLAMAALSVQVRGQGWASIGVAKVERPGRLAASMLAVAAAWSLVQLAVTLPIANHLSGQEQDLSAFADLEGNVGLLAGYLVLSWTVAAVGEEVAYRGYLLTRVGQALGGRRVGIVLAVVISSLLFGRVHTEQGAIGVLVTALDGVVFCLVRYRYRTVWAATLVHGFNNTLGFIAFFLVGPIHGFW